MPAQEVTINGVIHDLDYEPSLRIGSQPMRRTPIEINGKMVHGVNINGYDYPPAETGSVLYLPGLPGYGSTIWDRSPYANHGTITGATWTRLASGLWVLQFGPVLDDVVSIGAAASLVCTTAMTVLIWFNADDITPAANSYLFSKINYLGFRLNTTGTVQFLIAAPGWASSSSSVAQTGRDGQWIFAAGTYDKAFVRVYIDGVASGTPTAETDNIADASDTCYLGNIDASSGNWFAGKMVLWRLLNVALSASQIAAIYQQERHLFRI